MPARPRRILIVLPGITSLGREMGEQLLLAYSRTNGRHARTYARMHPPRGICTAFIGSVKFD